MNARMERSGLTAYNHNLDTSREFYPKVGRQHFPLSWPAPLISL
jgi:biotin synthase-like enzyme